MNRRHQMTIAMSSMIVLTLALLGIAATAVARAGSSAPTLRIDYTMLGEVDLHWGVPGAYSDALVAPSAEILDTMPDLGEIDLALWLEKSANNVTGYVDLTTTLVFTTEYTVDTTTPTTTTVTPKSAGPQLSGTFDGVNLAIESERIEFVTAAGKVGQRQFRLIGTVSNGIATGEYRETIWGYSIDPQTIVGDFSLKVIESSTAVPTSVGIAQSAVSARQIGTIIMGIFALLALATVGVRIVRKS